MVPCGTVAASGVGTGNTPLVCGRQEGLSWPTGMTSHWCRCLSWLSTVILWRHTVSSNMSSDALLLSSCQRIGLDLLLFVWLFNSLVDRIQRWHYIVPTGEGLCSLSCRRESMTSASVPCKFSVSYLSTVRCLKGCKSVVQKSRRRSQPGSPRKSCCLLYSIQIQHLEGP